ncbi:TetR/AcrR family transcriptional regulator [Pseudonocardia xinjiangensis]|uniref:TetR/AcrR family transcriptional regulator n=1 Tax=Pseudonocardia xinjiangensis TaxID=75289 RepID=A0ABX1RDB8_9PSEU|nr:TetR/AcrR family transcriptional regulator [Pseudonocardia xinjiangensis]NMH77120.1 TetR/AcrR family transcriptional regulator [Pseudonocardia xinjiangensis]
MTADPVTGLRADARRNRDQILAAAKQWFAVQGPDVPMEEIARAAGVGIGTLYRRFPDREALIQAVARDSFEKALAEARAAVAEEPTAWEALVRFLHQSQELRLTMQLAMTSPPRIVLRDDEERNELRRALIEVLDTVVHAAQAEGTLRGDIDTGDVAMVFALLVRQVPKTHDTVAGLAAERCMALILDGLRAPSSGAPLPGQPITAEDIGP